MNFYGEKIEDFYIKHPAASSTNPLSDGWAFDAGSAMILTSNAHHLVSQSQRLLFASCGQSRSVFAYEDVSEYRSQYTDVVEEGASTWTDVGTFVWDSYGWTCRKDGPILLVVDRLDDDNRRVARKIRVRVQLDFSTAPATRAIAAALSPVGSTPAQQCLAFASGNAANSTSPQYVSLGLEPVSPGVESLAVPWPCRSEDTAALGATDSYVIPVYLWTAWRFISGSPIATCGTIDSVCAWEVP